MYRTDNEAFVVYSVDGGMGASANVYFDTTDLSDTLPAGTAVNQHEWSRLKSGWINGGTSDVLQTEEDFVGRSWNEIVVWALDQLNILGTDLLAEPDIVAGVASLIANPDMTDEEIEALFVGTDYWHRQTIRALEWNDLPHAQQTQEKIEAALGLLSLAEVWVGVVEVLNVGPQDVRCGGRERVLLTEVARQDLRERHHLRELGVAADGQLEVAWHNGLLLGVAAGLTSQFKHF